MTRHLGIAVADDEPDMRDYYARVLPSLGHEVVAVARTGRELVEQCHAARVDLLIADIKMPEMDGLEAAAEICGSGPVPVILVSAYSEPELIQRADEQQVLAYLVKPIQRADLETAIAIAMGRFEELKALRSQATALRQALEDRKIIERAKGVLMRRAGLDEAEAFRRLQKIASESNQRLVEIAQTILTAEAALVRPRNRP